MSIDSPVSKAFAARLAKYAYDPTSSAGAASTSFVSPSGPSTLRQSPGSHNSATPTKQAHAGDRRGGARRRARSDSGYLEDEQVEEGFDRDSSISTSISPMPALRTGEPRASVRGQKIRTSSPISNGLMDEIDNEKSAEVTNITKTVKSPRVAKSAKKPRPYAGPEVYAHLKPVTDHLVEGLDSESEADE